MSPRKKKARNCVCPLRDKVGNIFNPAGKPLNELEIVALERDELEALYLCDGQGHNQEWAGVLMGVSRGTVQRLLARARKKMVEVLVGEKALVIAGEISKMRPADIDSATSINAGDVVPDGSSCGRGDSEPCQGPLSCPWRSDDDSARSQSGMEPAIVN